VASHDLQEPLRKIRAFSDRLTARLGESLDDKSADYLGRMVGAAERMQTLINDLLAFSRLTSRAQPFQSVDLSQVVREVVDDLDLVLAETRGRVEVGELPVVDAESVQMRQLFQNLIGNAVKYRHPERVPVVAVSAEEGRLNGSVKIRVEDNGIGFDPSQSERIFQLFQRLHGRGEYEGTGMGLAISRRIAERHGGTLTAAGEPEKGSTFLLTLPIHQPTGEDRT
jgi:light-regulated signal transduction histidine kinase (bacteriophytochrome)